MIAVVREEQPAVFDVVPQPLALRALKRTSLWPVMKRNGNAPQLVRVGGDHDLFADRRGMFVYSTTELRTLAATFGL